MTDKLTTEVIGFRQWQVDDDLRLRSAHVGAGWERGVNTARCDDLARTYANEGRTRQPHAAPAPDCHCGLYALHAPTFWYGPEAADRMPSSFWLVGRQPRYVAGLVVAWGRIECHHDGFRAQHARVVALAVPDRKYDAVIARAVAAEYGVPTIPQEILERVAGEFGNPIPSELRPPKPDRFTDSLALVYGSIQSSIQNINGAWISFGTAVTAGVESIEGEDEPSAPPTVEDRIRELRRPKYDPLAFKPKRKGGKR